ncbi:MAG: agmatinase [Paludibacteraceae bacterium]|nr:agmatinase [Paludibacteraceae bacterium]MBP8627633.1 agmatinase [Paludibacteraceae bacterium]MBP8781829.1 agmatinase [Paludibacteraceae bacterium]NLK92308.1 agmatinase [Bacteroidales bacterium]
MERFAGVPDQYAVYETAKMVVLPVPYDETSSWIKGSDKGPEALLDASVALEWYDIETQTQVYKKGIFTALPITEKSSPELLCNAVQERVTTYLKDGKFPVTIGGNHTVSIGAIRAAASQYADLTILQMDAHSDLRPSYEGSQLNHACVMYQASQLCPITQVGIRSMCEEELGLFKEDRIFYAHAIAGQTDWQQKALQTLSKNVYLTIDLDVFDPSVLPSTGTPEPGGLRYYEVLHFLRSVFAQYNVVGFDVVELCPNPNERASDFLAARLMYQLMTYKFL